MAGKWFKDQAISTGDIENWYQLEGKHRTGCAEGRLKEHARKSSTDVPGEAGVADLMLVEGRNEIKIPFYIH